MASTGHARRFAITALIAAIPVLALCCFTTLTIYSGNSEEFSAAYTDLASIYLPYCALLVMLLGLPGTFLNDGGLTRYRGFLAALGILVWLQGNVLVWDYGVLDGRSISWLAGAWRGVLDLGIWIVLLFAATRGRPRINRALTAAAIATFAIQAAIAVTTVAGDPGGLVVRSEPAAASANRDDVFGFSTDRNVVHILMDGFQTDILQGILAAKGGEELERELQGFTLFEHNLGAFPYTLVTIPAYLAGERYTNQIPVEDFVGMTLQGRTILSAAFDAGYEVDIAAPTGLANRYSKARHTNVYAIRSGDHVDERENIVGESAKLVDLALFRDVPHFAKALVYRDQLWVFQGMVEPESYQHLQYFADLSFLRRLAERMSADRDTPVYKLIHVMLSHKPTVGTAACEFAGNQVTSRKTVTAHATCSLRTVVSVLKRMQELGVYDNSLIVLMGDHGAWVPIDGLQAPAGVGGKPSALNVAMATPVLAIKPPHAKGSLRVSDAETSVLDVPSTIASIIGLPAEFPGRPAMTLSENETRERWHTIFGFGHNDYAPGYLFPMHEFRVTGNPYDLDSWQRTRRLLPGGVVESDLPVAASNAPD